MTDQRSDDAVLGTADYVAPEQARDSGDMDVRADIYSLGATFYFLLAGRAPFADGTLNQKLLWHQMKAPPPLRRLRPEVSEAMAAVVAQDDGEGAARSLPDAGRGRGGAGPVDAVAVGPAAVRLPAAEVHRPRRPAVADGLALVRFHRGGTGKPGLGRDAGVPRAHAAAGRHGRGPGHAVCGPHRRPDRGPDASRAAPGRRGLVPPLRRLRRWQALFRAPVAGAGQFHPSPRRRPCSAALAYLAGGAAAVLLLIAGVCLVLALLPTGHKPAVPATGPSVETPSRPRGPAHLRATMKGPDAIELTWEDPDGPSSGFRIDRAADAYFTKDLHSFSVGPVRSCTDAELKPGATYYYRVRALRTAGESSVSNTAWPAPNYGSDGFTTIGLDLNGGATVADKVLHLTDLNPNEARSTFYRQEVDVRAFRTKFRFRVSGGPQTADAFTFCIQSGDSTLVGQAGAGLGYQDIPKSVAVKFDLWNNDGEGQNSTGLFRNGDKPSNPGVST